jgi:hypothetical protein
MDPIIEILPVNASPTFDAGRASELTGPGILSDQAAPSSICRLKLRPY